MCCCIGIMQFLWMTLFDASMTADAAGSSTCAAQVGRQLLRKREGSLGAGHCLDLGVPTLHSRKTAAAQTACRS